MEPLMKHADMQSRENRRHLTSHTKSQDTGLLVTTPATDPAVAASRANHSACRELHTPDLRRESFMGKLHGRCCGTKKRGPSKISKDLGEDRGPVVCTPSFGGGKDFNLRGERAKLVPEEAVKSVAGGRSVGTRRRARIKPLERGIGFPSADTTVSCGSKSFPGDPQSAVPPKVGVPLRPIVLMTAAVRATRASVHILC